MYIEKLNQAGILDKQVFEPVDDLVDSDLLHLRANIANNDVFLGKRMTKYNKNC